VHVLTEIKNAWAAWKWSAAVLAGNAAPVAALIVLVALWAAAGYAWLGLPESSTLILVITLVWALAQVAVAIVILSAVARSTSEAPVDDSRRLSAAALRFSGSQFARGLVWAVGVFIVVMLVARLFAWFNYHALEVASFFTLHAQKPVSQVPVRWGFQVIEAYVWLVLTGFLFSFLILLLRDGRGTITGRVRCTLAASAWRAPLLTTLLVALIFAGGASKLAGWHPRTPPGPWDYTQMLVRLGGALVWLVVGWLLELLSLARLVRASDK